MQTACDKPVAAIKKYKNIFLEKWQEMTIKNKILKQILTLKS